MILRDDKFDDKSLITPTREELVQNRIKNIEAPVTPMKPTDNSPNGMALFASMLNGVANIGKSISGIVAQNDQSIEDREYAKIVPQLEMDMAKLVDDDIAVLPDNYDAILAKYKEVFDSSDIRESLKERLKTRLINETQNQAGRTFVASVEENQQASITSYNDKLADAIQRNDRVGVSTIIAEAFTGENAYLPKSQYTAQLVKARRELDLNVVKRQLYDMDYNEAMNMLDTDTSYIVETDTYQGQGDREYRLSTDEKETLKTMVHNNMVLEVKATEKEKFQQIGNLFAAVKDPNFDQDAFIAGKIPGYELVTDKLLAYNNAMGFQAKITTTAQKAEFDDLLGKWDDGTLTIPQINERSDYLSATDRHKLLALFKVDKVKTKTPEELAKLSSKDFVENIKQMGMSHKFDLATLQKMVSDRIGTTHKGGDMDGQWRLFSNDQEDLMKYFETYNTPTEVTVDDIVDNLDISDDPYLQFAAQRAATQAIIENNNIDNPLNKDQLTQSVMATITLATNEEAIETIKKAANGKVVNWVYSWGGSAFEKGVEAQNTGLYSGLRNSDPALYQKWIQNQTDQIEVLTGEEYKGTVEFHDGYLPVYTIDGVKKIYDVQDKRPVLIPLETALKKYKNLALGYPVGELEGDGYGNHTGRIMTYHGWHNIKDTEIFKLDDVKDLFGNPVEFFYLTENGKRIEGEPPYMTSKNYTGKTIIVPIKSDINNNVEIADEVKGILEAPESEKEKENKARFTGYNQVVNEAGEVFSW